VVGYLVAKIGRRSNHHNCSGRGLLAPGRKRTEGLISHTEFLFRTNWLRHTNEAAALTERHGTVGTLNRNPRTVPD
jgi:hypothetical protein